MTSLRPSLFRDDFTNYQNYSDMYLAMLNKKNTSIKRIRKTLQKPSQTRNRQMTAIILKSPHVLNHSSSHIIIFHHHSILVKKSQDLLEMNYHLVAICYHSSNDSKPKFVKISSSNSKIKVQYHPTSQLASAHEGKKRRKLTPPRPQRAPRQPQWRRCRRLCRPGLASTPASATTAKCNAMYRNSE